jgi:hypothetical protein
MNARTQNLTAALVAMALTLAVMAPTASAAPGAAERAKKSAACRTVENYTMSAWIAPAVVVVHSAAGWNKWNEQMAADGLALAAEAVPQGVDWAKECVVVVALGELSGPYAVSMKGAKRTLSGVQVMLEVEAGHGGSSPALVLAMPRSASQNLSLVSDAIALPELRTYPESNLAGDGDGGNPVAAGTSWGAVKAEYR